MRFKSKLVLVLVFIIMSFSVFAAKSNKKEDVKMPNIVLYDQYGKKHNIEEYKGKVVVIISGQLGVDTVFKKCQNLKKYTKNLVQIKRM